MDGTERNAGGKVLLFVAAALVLLAVAWAAGLFAVNTNGSLKAPEVSVKGGEVPDVDVETAKVDVGTKHETVKVPDVKVETKDAKITVPTVSVEKPGESNSHD